MRSSLPFKKKFGRILILCLLANMLLLSAASAQVIRYVNANASGSNNGSSWANAYTNLQTALDAAASGDQVWVARGTYTPSKMAISGYGRSKTFLLKDGVSLYGGFLGGETLLTARDPRANKTILSGDLNGNDGSDFTNNSDNSYHVVAANNLTAETVLDGFTITGGNADAYYGSFLGDGEGSNEKGGGLYIKGGGSNLTVANCVFVSNYASFYGAAVRVASSKPNFRNCVLTSNKTSGWGGGLQSTNSEVTMVNCVIAKNTANYGGGIYLTATTSTSFAHLVNCTVYGNTAVSIGGALYYVNGAYASLNNSIIWGNESPSNPGIYGSNYLDVVRYNNVQGTGVRAGEANINENPQFVDVSDLDGADDIWGTADDGLTLQGISPSANTGKDEDVTVSTDITGAARKQGVVNMGAYETLYPKFSPVISWATPAAITYGTAISLTQLNATAKDINNAGLAGSYTYYTNAAKTETALSKILPAGTHTLYLVFTPANGDYAVAEKQVNITVNKAAAGVSIAGSGRLYNGTARSATATTTPADLAVRFVYKKNGVTLTSAPVNAGEYTVTATVDDANYTGSRTETYTINKATGVVDLGNLFRVYDGSEKTVVPTTSPAGLNTTVVYKKNGVALAGNPVNAGTYEVVATMDDENYTATATGTLTIQKATTAIAISNLEQQYDGQAKQVTVATTPADLPVTVTYNGSEALPAAVGTYTVIATVNHENYTGELTGTLTIVGTTAIGDEVEKMKVTFYPNPTDRLLYLDLQEDALVEVMSVTGQVLVHETAKAGEVKLDLANLRTGQYILRVQSKKQQVHKKFIKR